MDLASVSPGLCWDTVVGIPVDALCICVSQRVERECLHAAIP